MEYSHLKINQCKVQALVLTIKIRTQVSTKIRIKVALTKINPTHLTNLQPVQCLAKTPLKIKQPKAFQTHLLNSNPLSQNSRPTRLQVAKTKVVAKPLASQWAKAKIIIKVTLCFPWVAQLETSRSPRDKLEIDFEIFR